MKSAAMRMQIALLRRRNAALRRKVREGHAREIGVRQRAGRFRADMCVVQRCLREHHERMHDLFEIIERRDLPE